MSIPFLAVQFEAFRQDGFREGFCARARSRGARSRPRRNISAKAGDGRSVRFLAVFKAKYVFSPMNTRTDSS
jgi:hypothetical protein